MIEFLRKYKTDFYYILGLLFIFCISAFVLGHIYGDLFMDCGREAYLPQAILEGKVLYKDVFGMYNPLSYQINALLYLVFGSSFNTLYFASYFNSFVLLIGLYLICRVFITEFYSFVFSLIIMSVYVFGTTSLISYIYPYAFAFPYAACCFTYSVLFVLYFMKTGSIRFNYLAWLCLGFSIANKPEFGLCFIPMLVVLADKKVHFKEYIYSALLCLIPITLSYGVLFLQGFNLSNLIEYLKFNKHFFETEEQIIYTIDTIAPVWTAETFRIMFKDFLYTIFICVVGGVYFSLFNKNNYLKLFAFAISIFFICFNQQYASYLSENNIFSWCLPVFIVIMYFQSENIKTSKSKMLLFLFAISIFSSARINLFAYNKFSYGIYVLIPVLAIWIYFIDVNIKYISKYKYKLYVALSLIILSFSNIAFIKMNSVNYKKIESLKGTLSSQNYQAGELFNEIVDWVNENTKKEDSVLVLPEGIMVNYLTNRPTKLKYYHLIPNHISALGEGNIINGLNYDKPDYIILNSIEYRMYGSLSICKDFGYGICKFVKDNYKKVKKIDINDEYNALIYRRNSKKI